MFTKTVFVTLVLCIFSVVSGDVVESERAKERRLSCIAESGVDAMTIENIRTKNVYVHDPKIHCYSACYMKKMKVMTADGAYDADTARILMTKANIDPANIDEIIASCKDLRGNDHCETAAKLAECFFKTKKFDFTVLEQLEI